MFNSFINKMAEAGNVTPLQARMLVKIARNEMTQLNGGEPRNSDEINVWADCVIETAQDKGTFTSLLNAGLVWHDSPVNPERAPEDLSSCGCGLTDKGFEVYKSMNAPEYFNEGPVYIS